MAADTEITLGINNRQALNALRQVEGATSKLRGEFLKFDNILGGLALGAIIQQSYEMSKANSTLTTGTMSASSAMKNMSVNVKELQIGIIQALQPLNNFVSTITISADGVTRLINTFVSLAVTIGTLFIGGGILNRLIVGLNRVGASGTKSASLLSVAFTNIKNYFKDFGTLITGVFGNKLTPIDKLIASLGALKDVLIAVAGALGLVSVYKSLFGEIKEQLPDTSVRMVRPGTFEIIPKSDIERLKQTKTALQEQFFQNSKNLNFQNDLIREQLALETRLVGKTAEQIELNRALLQLEQQRKTAIANASNLSAEQIAAGGARMLPGEIAKMNRQYDNQRDALIDYITTLQQARAEEQLRLRIVQQGSEKAIRNIREMKMLMDRTEAQGMERAIRNIRSSMQEFGYGWDQKVKEFISGTKNMANLAGNIFDSVFQNMENALDNFVRTGKLSFKDLTRSILQDLISLTLQRSFRMLFLSTAGGTDFLSSMGRFFAGGFAEGGYIPPGKVGLVGERGPEFISGPAQITPMDKMASSGGGSTTIININALDAKSVTQLFAENRKTLLGVTEQARKELNVRSRI